MVTEQEKTVEALKMAIRMETDGKAYYLKASRKSSNELGKGLLQSLAEEEDIHRIKFQEIYDTISNEMAWPQVDFQPDGGESLRTLFSMATSEIKPDNEASSTELDAVQTAMAMENKTYDFYINQGTHATGSMERDFYKSLAAQERIHHQVLLDYYEYLKDPAAWFVDKEHSSLDGG